MANERTAQTEFKRISFPFNETKVFFFWRGEENLDFARSINLKKFSNYFIYFFRK